MGRARKRRRGRPAHLAHLLPRDIDHRKVLLGLMLALERLEIIAREFCKDKNKDVRDGVELWFEEREISDVIKQIMPTLEIYAGYWNMLEQETVFGEAFDKAIHNGVFSDESFRPLRSEPDRFGRRLPIYKKYNPDQDSNKTDQQRVNAIKYQTRRSLRDKIAVSLRQFLDAPADSELRRLVGKLASAYHQELSQLVCPNHAHGRDHHKIFQERDQAINEVENTVREATAEGRKLH